MRKLTILRRKTFVACLVKFNVYIEDREHPETVINEVPCRFLGKIKNGTESTFEIDGELRKVFVVADKLSRGYCFDYYQMPAGEEDVSLSGAPRFNLATGNAFRFDQVSGEDVVANRNKGFNKGIVIFIAVVVVGLVAGFVCGFYLF